MKITSFVINSVLLLVLSKIDASATEMHGTPNLEIPRFHVTRMISTPKIDGKIDLLEWKSATAISGVADQSTDASKPLIPRPTTFSHIFQ